MVHPKHRTIGLKARTPQGEPTRAGNPYIEPIAVMARYNPFAGRVGRTRIAGSKPDPKLIRAAEALSARDSTSTPKEAGDTPEES